MQLAKLPLDGVPRAPPLTTKAPSVPTLTARAVNTPVPVPVRPVEIGSPIAFVSVRADGTPRLGVVSVGDVANTMLPEPVVVLPSAVTVPLVGNVNVVVPVVVNVVEYAPEVARVDPSASVSVAPVAGAVIVILLTDPESVRFPLLSTTKDAVVAPVIVKFNRSEAAPDAVFVTASLMPFQVTVLSVQVSVRL